MGDQSLKKNITLVYILSFLRRMWFWLGIWVFYYLMFTDYAGIGLIESIMIVTVILAEVPTGAIADLYGRKSSTVISWVLAVIGSFIFAFAGDFTDLAIAVFILSIAGAFYSGSVEALAFDSLKEIGEEKRFDSVVSNIQTLGLVAMAVSSGIGGLMYTAAPNLPFIAGGITGIIGLIVSFFLKEPHIDTEKFTFRQFKEQNTQGFKQLFKTNDVKNQTILFLIIGFFVVIGYEVLNDLLAVEFGFSPVQLGWLWSLLALLSAGASQLTPTLMKKFSTKNLFIIVGFIIAVSYAVSPLAGLIFGAITLVIRTSLQAVFDNLTSILINRSTSSEYRATTLSTFNLIKNIPYIATAYFMGVLMDVFSAQYFSLVLGITLALLMIFTFLYYRKNRIPN